MSKYLSLILILMLFMLARADDYRGNMKRGEKSYKNQDYAAAAEHFNQAEVLKPEDPKAAFNTGASMYKSNDAAEASEKFTQAAGLAEGQIKSDAYYNQGNALYQGQKYQEALEAYRNSLMIDPTREDAKYNYELAQKKLQQQQQQQKQQKQDQKDRKDQKNQQQQKQNQKQDQNKQQQQQKKDEKQQQQSKPQKGEMNKKEAKELLDAFKQDEKDVQKELKKFQVRPESRRDW